MSELSKEELARIAAEERELNARGFKSERQLLREFMGLEPSRPGLAQPVFTVEAQRAVDHGRSDLGLSVPQMQQRGIVRRAVGAIREWWG